MSSGNSKADWIAKRNRTRFAMRQVASFLRVRGLPVYRVKRNELIRSFAYVAGLEIVGSPTDWLIDLWAGQENEHVAKQETGFYLSAEWVVLRRKVLRHYGPACMKCGTADQPSVDHVKPRSLFPALELDFDNMQVLCRPCNSSKSNRSEADYR